MSRRRIGSVAFIAILLSTTGNAAEAPTKAPTMLCNRMTVELESVALANAHITVTLPSALRPGDCAPLSGLAAGSYRLQFIERSPDSAAQHQAASCRRDVNVVAGTDIIIAPDDGARCVM